MRSQIEDEEPALDMTPMIDCVFLLLIFFLVATTMKKIDKELPLTLPDSEASVEVQQPKSYHIIGLDVDGGHHLDGVPLGVGQLQRDLRNLAGTEPDVKIRLDVDRQAPFQKVMEILDILRFEELENVSINTRKSQ